MRDLDKMKSILPLILGLLTINAVGQQDVESVTSLPTSGKSQGDVVIFQGQHYILRQNSFEFTVGRDTVLGHSGYSDLSVRSYGSTSASLNGDIQVSWDNTRGTTRVVFQAADWGSTPDPLYWTITSGDITESFTANRVTQSGFHEYDDNHDMLSSVTSGTATVSFWTDSDRSIPYMIKDSYDWTIFGFTDADDVKLANAITNAPTSFLELTDTPNSYTNDAGKIVAVNTLGNQLVFLEATNLLRTINTNLNLPFIQASIVGQDIILTRGDGTSQTNTLPPLRAIGAYTHSTYVNGELTLYRGQTDPNPDILRISGGGIESISGAVAAEQVSQPNDIFQQILFRDSNDVRLFTITVPNALTNMLTDIDRDPNNDTGLELLRGHTTDANRTETLDLQPLITAGESKSAFDDISFDSGTRRITMTAEDGSTDFVTLPAQSSTRAISGANYTTSNGQFQFNRESGLNPLIVILPQWLNSAPITSFDNGILRFMSRGTPVDVDLSAMINTLSSNMVTAIGIPSTPNLDNLLQTAALRNPTSNLIDFTTRGGDTSTITFPRWFIPDSEDIILRSDGGQPIRWADLIRGVGTGTDPTSGRDAIIWRTVESDVDMRFAPRGSEWVLTPTANNTGITFVLRDDSDPVRTSTSSISWPSILTALDNEAITDLTFSTGTSELNIDRRGTDSMIALPIATGLTWDPDSNILTLVKAGSVPNQTVSLASLAATGTTGTGNVCPPETFIGGSLSGTDLIFNQEGGGTVTINLNNIASGSQLSLTGYATLMNTATTESNVNPSNYYFVVVDSSRNVRRVSVATMESEFNRSEVSNTALTANADSTASTTLAPSRRQVEIALAAAGTGGGATAFTNLTDTPSELGTEGQVVKISGGAITWQDDATGTGGSGLDTAAVNTRIRAHTGQTTDTDRFAASRMGSGTASANTVLYGDRTWKPAPTGGTGGIAISAVKPFARTADTTSKMSADILGQPTNPITSAGINAANDRLLVYDNSQSRYEDITVDDFGDSMIVHFDQDDRINPDPSGFTSSDNGTFPVWNNTTDAWVNGDMGDANGFTWNFDMTDNEWEATYTRGPPAGGSSGQVLAKSSGADYALEWITPASGGGSVDRASVYAQAKDIIQGGRGAQVVADDTDREITINAQTPTGNELPPQPWYVGERFVLLQDDTVDFDHIEYDDEIADDAIQISYRFGGLTGSFANTGPYEVIGYSAEYGADGSPNAQLRNRVYVKTQGAYTMPADAQLVFYREGTARMSYDINDTAQAGFRHWYRVPGLNFGNLSDTGYRYAINFEWNSGANKLYPGTKVDAGDITFAGAGHGQAGWVPTPSIPAVWAQFGRPEPRTLFALTQLIDGPATGLSTATSANAPATSGFHLFEPEGTGTTFDFDEPSRDVGIINVEADLTFTARSSNAIGFDATAETRQIKTGFTFATSVNSSTPYSATARNGVRINTWSIIDTASSPDVSVGTVSLYLAKNANNELGYYFYYAVGSGGAARTFSISVNMEADFEHNDGDSDTGSTTFAGLTDTPSAISANLYLRGNSAGSLLEFGALPSAASTTAGIISLNDIDSRIRDHTGQSSGSSDQFAAARIPTIQTAKIADEAVTTAKIDNDAVTADKIDDDAVGYAKLNTDVTNFVPNTGTTGHVLTKTASGASYQASTGLNQTQVDARVREYTGQGSSTDTIPGTKLGGSYVQGNATRFLANANGADAIWVTAPSGGASTFAALTDTPTTSQLTAAQGDILVVAPSANNITTISELNSTHLANNAVDTSEINAEAVTETKLDIGNSPSVGNIIGWDANGLVWTNDMVGSGGGGSGTITTLLDWNSSGEATQRLSLTFDTLPFSTNSATPISDFNFTIPDGSDNSLLRFSIAMFLSGGSGGGGSDAGYSTFIVPVSDWNSLATSGERHTDPKNVFVLPSGGNSLDFDGNQFGYEFNIFLGKGTGGRVGLFYINNATVQEAPQLREIKIQLISGGGGSSAVGATTFAALTDTPQSITANQYLRGNSAGTALEFVAAPTGGTGLTQSQVDARVEAYTGQVGTDSEININRIPSITSSKITDGTIANVDISTTANIAGSKIANDSIGTEEIEANGVGASELAADSVNLEDINTSNTGTANQILARTASGLNWVDDQQGTGGGSSTFSALTDTPNTYTGQGGKLVAVNSAASALEFIDSPSGVSVEPAWMFLHMDTTTVYSGAANPTTITQIPEVTVNLDNPGAGSLATLTANGVTLDESTDIITFANAGAYSIEYYTDVIIASSSGGTTAKTGSTPSSDSRLYASYHIERQAASSTSWLTIKSSTRSAYTKELTSQGPSTAKIGGSTSFVVDAGDKLRIRASGYVNNVQYVTSQRNTFGLAILRHGVGGTGGGTKNGDSSVAAQQVLANIGTTTLFSNAAQEWASGGGVPTTNMPPVTINIADLDTSPSPEWITLNETDDTITFNEAGEYTISTSVESIMTSADGSTTKSADSNGGKRLWTETWIEKQLSGQTAWNELAYTRRRGYTKELNLQGPSSSITAGQYSLVSAAGDKYRVRAGGYLRSFNFVTILTRTNAVSIIRPGR